jgi:hypothetical protein
MPPDRAFEGEVTVEPTSVPKTNSPNFTGVYLDRFPHGKPNCPFVLNLPVDNISPLGSVGSKSNADAHTPEGGDPSTTPTCEQKSEKAVGETAADRPTDAPKKTLNVCGMYPAVPPMPKQGEFAPNCPFVFGLPPHLLLSESRLDEFYASFNSIDVGPSAARLAKSGFRFIVPGANEKCVYCEGDFGSRFWNSNGNLVSRKRWNGLDQYIHLLKGGDFIREFYTVESTVI